MLQERIPKKYKLLKSKYKVHNDIVTKVCKIISRTNEPTDRSLRYTKKVVRKFFRKAIPAVLNGYPIKIYYALTIALHYEPIRKLEKHEKGVYFFSSKVIDYMFCIKLTGNIITHDVYLTPTKIISKKLQEILNSNLVYQFVKNETNID